MRSRLAAWVGLAWATGSLPRGCVSLGAGAATHSSKSSMPSHSAELNVLGGQLEPCGTAPMTGFLRDGFCKCPGSDTGVHSVCSEVTEDFLAFTKGLGNDLSTPKPAWGFPGLKPGDRWCLCAGRWLEAAQAGKAPGVVLGSTHARTLEIVPLEMLTAHAVGRSLAESGENGTCSSE